MDASESRNHQKIIRYREIKNLDFEIRQVRFQVDDVVSFLSWLRDLSHRHDVTIVCFNADLMAGREHAISAMLHAKRAMNNDTCISSSLEIEALLYAAGSRQCQEAIKFGVHQGWNNCYLCISPVNPRVWSELLTMMTISTEDWERITDDRFDILVPLFDITNAEIAVTGKDRIKDLVLERVALLDVNK